MPTGSPFLDGFVEAPLLDPLSFPGSPEAIPRDLS